MAAVYTGLGYHTQDKTNVLSPTAMSVSLSFWNTELVGFRKLFVFTSYLTDLDNCTFLQHTKENIIKANVFAVELICRRHMPAVWLCHVDLSPPHASRVAVSCGSVAATCQPCGCVMWICRRHMPAVWLCHVDLKTVGDKSLQQQQQLLRIFSNPHRKPTKGLNLSYARALTF